MGVKCRGNSATTLREKPGGLFKVYDAPRLHRNALGEVLLLLVPKLPDCPTDPT
jgi:hypothetical protein